MTLLCCSFASASFTSRNFLSLSVDCLNSKMYTICRVSWLRPHLVACPRNDLRRQTLDRGCTVPLDFFWQVLSPLYSVPVPPALPCCRFLETLLVVTACSCYFLCQACQTWACFLSYRCLQVGSLNCRYHSFAACTVDVTVCLSRQTISALTGPGFLATYWVPRAIGTRSWDQKTQSWLSHSHHWVCPEHAVSSPAGTRRWIFWKPPFLAN